jgi:hypothetical protein
MREILKFASEFTKKEGLKKIKAMAENDNNAANNPPPQQQRGQEHIEFTVRVSLGVMVGI